MIDQFYSIKPPRLSKTASIRGQNLLHAHIKCSLFMSDITRTKAAFKESFVL